MDLASRKTMVAFIFLKIASLSANFRKSRKNAFSSLSEAIPPSESPKRAWHASRHREVCRNDQLTAPNRRKSRKIGENRNKTQTLICYSRKCCIRNQENAMRVLSSLRPIELGVFAKFQDFFPPKNSLKKLEKKKNRQESCMRN